MHQGFLLTEIIKKWGSPRPFTPNEHWLSSATTDKVAIGDQIRQERAWPSNESDLAKQRLRYHLQFEAVIAAWIPQSRLSDGFLYPFRITTLLSISENTKLIGCSLLLLALYQLVTATCLSTLNLHGLADHRSTGSGIAVGLIFHLIFYIPLANVIHRESKGSHLKHHGTNEVIWLMHHFVCFGELVNFSGNGWLDMNTIGAVSLET